MHTPEFEANLTNLRRDGFLLIPQAIDQETVSAWKTILYDMYEKEAYCGRNGVGNVYFNKLLAQQSALTQALIAQDKVAPYLKAIMGKQCQLRSVRAHVNPAEYRQEWHMDFYDYYYQAEKAEALQPATAVCMNTTFYLTDNPPERARLTFVDNYLNRPIPAELIPHLGYTEDRSNPFQQWCDEQAHVDLHPMAGDAVIFYSHIPHQGAKMGPDPEGEIRANLVLHYQQNPMYPGIHFVSDPQFTLDTLRYNETFPFAQP